MINDFSKLNKTITCDEISYNRPIPREVFIRANESDKIGSTGLFCLINKAINQGLINVTPGGSVTDTFATLAGQTITFPNGSTLVVPSAADLAALQTQITSNDTDITALQADSHPDDDVETVTGGGLNLTNPRNPIVNTSASGVEGTIDLNNVASAPIADAGGLITATTIEDALQELAAKGSPISITSVDFKPTGNPNEYVTETTWVDKDGSTVVTTDNTPVVITPTVDTNLGLTDLTQVDPLRIYNGGDSATNVLAFNNLRDLLINVSRRFQVNSVFTSIDATSGNYVLPTPPTNIDSANTVDLLVRNTITGEIERKSIESNSYIHTFVAADWVGSTTLTIPQSTHGLTAQGNYHNTVRDASGNKVNVGDNVAASGDITLTITAAPFAGTVLITK